MITHLSVQTLCPFLHTVQKLEIILKTVFGCQHLGLPYFIVQLDLQINRGPWNSVKALAWIHDQLYTDIHPGECFP